MLYTSVIVHVCGHIKKLECCTSRLSSNASDKKEVVVFKVPSA